MTRSKRGKTASGTEASREQIKKVPVSVVTKAGKTTVHQFEGRRFVRLGEVKGKTVTWVELFTSGGDSHSITIRFRDRTALCLGIAPGFILDAEYYSVRTGNYRLLKKWPQIKSEK